MKQLEIFGKIIFESDADAWLKLCKDQKREWILKHTEQRNEQLIDEFINNPSISKQCGCIDCGKNKKQNESSGVSEAASTDSQPASNGAASIRNSTKRPKAAKSKKN